MKNKKGFTIVELLAVILILSLLMAIAIPSIFSISDRVRNKSLDSKIELIEKAAVIYAQNNSNSIKSKLGGKCTSSSDENCECTTSESGRTSCKYKYTIYLDELVELGEYKSENTTDDKKICDVVDPTDSIKCLDCGTIDIYLDSNHKTATATYNLPESDATYQKTQNCKN